MKSSSPALLLASLALRALPAEAAWGSVIREDDKPVQDGIKLYISSFRQSMVVIHAILAALAFLLLMPSAIVIARYFKKRAPFDNGKWVQAHMYLNLAASATVIAVFVTGVYATGGLNSPYHLKNPHMRIGLSIFIATMFQAVLGLANVFLLYKPHVRTPIQNKLHILLGWMTWGLAISNIPVGMVLYGSPIYLFVLYAIVSGFWLIVFVAFEVVGGRVENHVIATKYQKVNWNGQIVDGYGEGKRLGSSSTA